MSPYDPGTIERLKWTHGPERAALIIAGEHEETNRDLRRWRNIGGEIRLPLRGRLEQAFGFMRRGMSLATSARRAGVSCMDLRDYVERFPP